jgi:FAD/FMN-containing dehydrogenase/Fe-S oxidoreductase
MNIHVPPNHRIAERLRAEIEGEVLFDAASRGRYSTDASFYQIEPVGVIVPKRMDDVAAALTIAREEGVAVLPRGGGTSQSGQTVGRALVIDFTKHLNNIVETDFENSEALVQPGIVMDDLNRQIKSSGLWFPVDVSTSSRATIGGMTGNNSCGTRSIRYGIMRDNVRAIDAWLADGTEAHFGLLDADFEHANVPDAARDLFRDLRRFGQREAEHIAGAFPEVSRRVGGYLIDSIMPDAAGHPINTATLLCGSEGTLAISKQIRLKLSRQPTNKALGLCHFSTFRAAMEAAQNIVKLGPVAVELVDKTLIELATDIAMFRPIMETYVRGKPDALLLVEFAEEDQDENVRRLDRLEELMGDLGAPNAVVKVANAQEQKAIWGVRAAGLNIMMSMKSAGKPVSFIEDCAVPLENLADYTERLTEVFAKHGTTGTWYAHASVGCLHVRPVLNLKLAEDTKKMRAIAEAAFEMVREYKGSHSGEHGDGLVRSEFHEKMYGRRTIELFEEIKDRFDPDGILNPGKIVRPSKMDDRSLFRFKPNYKVDDISTVLDWSDYTGSAGGLQGAVEMCNNNGECRKLEGGAMCPSYRVTRNECDVTRGRANTLRLAISGQLGADALTRDDVAEAMKLCVSCKACRRECPTGVDMARMKAEVLHARHNKFGATVRDTLVGYLPRYARYLGPLASLANLPAMFSPLGRLQEKATGFSAKRKLPTWQSRPWRPQHRANTAPAGGRRDVVLFADTFNRYFEPNNLKAAEKVLTALDYNIIHPAPLSGSRPVCCGRTFLSAGFIDEAKAESARVIVAVKPLIDGGATIVGLEPSCLFSMHDEFQAMHPGPATAQLATRALMFEEFLVQEAAAGHIETPIATAKAEVLVHGHCHQKSFGASDSVIKALELVEGYSASMIESSCCGMAGSFGYQAETYDTSMAMAEINLLPAVRAVDNQVIIAADGFSCRHQIKDGASREARHVAVILADAMRL